MTGTVQGVGFRPTVWRLARECNITGQVWNDSGGVSIRAWGSPNAVEDFLRRIEAEQPPLSRISRIERLPLGDAKTAPVPLDFEIVSSQAGEVHTGVAADAAVCPECLAEILDPRNRRYRYPFTNCTHCGPRLSIVRTIPYDRANTSMALFPMCSECQSEYNNPGDRRFHAQPNACADCGPQLRLQSANGKRITPSIGDDVITCAVKMIREGCIVAVKGIGGIHLACDAGNRQAVQRLRRRKQRYGKPFALMATDSEMISRYAKVDAKALNLLSARAAPIVILEAAGEELCTEIAPNQNTLGFMLPYTPLHHLLMQDMKRPIVLTSGNRSDEPQSIDNQDAVQRLEGIADYFLIHDRDIVNRLDDSVARIVDHVPRLLRRARGYAPQSIPLPPGILNPSRVLAMGGELKNTFCLLLEDEAIVSQHMGDLEDAACYRDYQQNLQLYRELFEFQPIVVAVDRHPNYLSTQLGKSLVAESDARLIEVQHHHAHIAASMVEHGLNREEKVIGVALDGLGYGEDGTIWGGEFLLAGYDSYQRLAFFQPVPMLGGTQAIREPWRNAFAHLSTVLGWERAANQYADLEIVRFLKEKPVDLLLTMAEKSINSPLASSAGRLFDAVAATLGVCRTSADFEGQAAIELEALASRQFERQADCAYGYSVAGVQLQWAPLWSALLQDLKARVAREVIAARFHHGVARAVAETATELCRKFELGQVVLSGGVFQNRLLLEQSSILLREQGIAVLSPTRTPANDGGLSLGQAVIAAVTCSD